jgi:hypothetical protein
MTPEQFAYWLQGFVELNGDNLPTEEQWQAVREHLATVFKKITPYYLNTNPPTLLPSSPICAVGMFQDETKTYC